VNYLQTAIGYITKNATQIGYGLCILIIVGLYASLKLEQSAREHDRVEMSDTLAAHDQLRVILENENGKLEGRYVFLENDLNKEASRNKVLSQYLEQSNSRVEELSRVYSEAVLDNERLTGILHKDSIGEYLTIDTTTRFFTLNALARLHPSPIFLINHLSIPDSTTVAFIRQGGLTIGTIMNSNPLIVNKSASFYVKTSQSTDEQGFNIFPYVIGGAVGGVVGYLIRAVTHK